MDSPMSAANDPTHPPVLKQVQWKHRYPLTHSQQRIWFLYKLFPDSLFYNISLVYSLAGAVREDVLYESFRDLFWRHDIMRARFGETDGRPFQVIQENVEFSLPIDDLNLMTHDQAAREDQILHDELNRSFDLQRDTLVRARLIRLAPDKYTLVLVMHHIITDMWSMDIFCRELSEFYNARLRNESAHLPELPLQYQFYAEWEQSEEHLRKQRIHESYWSKILQDGTPILDLPFDHTKPRQPNYRGDIERITVSKRVLRELRQLSKSTQTTLFMVLLAAYNVFLHRITGQSRVTVGTFLVNRHRKDLVDLIGILFNDLPLITDIDGDPTYIDLLKQTRRTVTGALAHADYFIDELLATQVAPTSSIGTLAYNVTFQLYFKNDRRLQLEGVVAHQRRVFQGSKFDLMLYGAVGEDSLDLWFNYNIDLFNAATVKRFLHHFNTLLQNIVAAPELPISQLDLLTRNEQYQLLYTFNNTLLPYPRDQTIHALFEDQVNDDPDGVAVIFNDDTARATMYTYGEINHRANQLARHIQRCGAGPTTIIGILLDRSAELVVAYLATLKAGAGCLLLDTHYPTQRIETMLDDSQATFIISEQNVIQCHRFQSSRHIVDVYDQGINREDGVNLGVPVTPHATAFVVYTSGSTGGPKGVVLPHQAVVNQVYNRRHRLEVRTDDIFCLSLSVAFSALPSQLLVPLLTGCPLVVYSQQTIMDPRALFARIMSDRVSIVEVTVSTLNAYLRHLETLGRHRPFLKRLRIVLSAGEKLTPSVAKRFYAAIQHVSLYTTYGQSECSGIICVARVPDDPSTQRIVEGYPSANTHVYLLDQYRRLVPIGVRGDVYFAGDSQAVGYINKPSLSSRVFVDNPFDQGTTMVRTGDIARRLPDGQIEVLGRRDTIVKIRGSHVDLVEVEEVIREFAGITDCIVTLQVDSDDDMYLVAYYILSQSIDVDVLRGHIAERLPDYMRPALFIELHALPLSANGKLDRAALPTPIRHTDWLESDVSNDVGQSLTNLWKHVLKTSDVTTDANFFRLGGHSLRAMELVALVDKIFGVEIPLTAVFEYPRLRDFAKFLAELLHSQTEQ